jgi:hypothetical protein
MVRNASIGIGRFNNEHADSNKEYTEGTERCLSDGGDDRARGFQLCLPLLHHPQV